MKYKKKIIPNQHSKIAVLKGGLFWGGYIRKSGARSFEGEGKCLKQSHGKRLFSLKTGLKVQPRLPFEGVANCV